MSAALPALLSCPASGAKWDIVPTLLVGETYTDNVSLVPDPSKKSDWITQVIPAISIVATGARLRFEVDYAVEAIDHARGQQYNQVNQHLNAIGNTELATQLLFVDAGARIDQVNVSLLGPVTTSNINTTGNRATVRTLFASPYLKRDFGSDLQSEARFTYSLVNADGQAALSNSSAERINLGLKSGPAYRLLAWNLDYVGETIVYENGQDISTEVIKANARRLITPTVGLLARVGYDRYKFGDIAPVTAGTSWSAGFDWTPTPRTRLAATAGHQFSGDAYYFDFTHRTRLTTWSAGYSQDVTTTRSTFFVPSTTSTTGYLDTLFLSQFPDPVARQKAVEKFIAQSGLPPSLNAPINFFSNQLFLVKRWQASAGILGVRNVLIANVFKETRQALVGNLVLPSTGDFAASNTVNQTGTSLQWNWRMTAQNAWNLGAAYTRNEFPGTGQTNHLTYVGMGLTRQIQPRLSGSLNYRWQHNDSNVSASSYTENAVFATLTMRF